MRFRYALLYVQDVAASLRFYERAFGQRTRFLAEGGGYGELDTEGAVLGFVSVAQAHGNLPRGFREGSSKEKPGNFEVGFATDDVQAAYDKAVAAGAQPYAPPEHKPWGQLIAYVRDPDGVLVEIAGKMDQAPGPAADASKDTPGATD